jgi:hypothetical protein
VRSLRLKPLNLEGQATNEDLGRSAGFASAKTADGSLRRVIRRRDNSAGFTMNIIALSMQMDEAVASFVQRARSFFYQDGALSTRMSRLRGRVEHDHRGPMPLLFMRQGTRSNDRPTTVFALRRTTAAAHSALRMPPMRERGRVPFPL